MNGTEFGLYYINYHSRLPLISGRSGTQAGVGNAAGAATAVQGGAQAFAGAIAGGLPVQAAIATAAAVVTPVAVQAAASRGGNLTAQTASQYATIGATQASLGVSASDIGRNATQHRHARVRTDGASTSPNFLKTSSSSA